MVSVILNKIKKNHHYMYSRSLKNKKIKNNLPEIKDISNKCKVSKASNEIMLDRFYNGKSIEFPFT